jgi:hypothetical protein
MKNFKQNHKPSLSVKEMVDFDFKLLVENTEENRRKIVKRGITQFYESGAFEIEFYPSEQDLYEDWYEYCEPIEGNKICEECEKNDYNLEEPELCPRFSKVYNKTVYVYDKLRNLAEEIIGRHVIIIHGCKKDAMDNTRCLFHSNDFYEAYENLKDWATKNFKKWLSFGNDDLNGWEVEGWKVQTKEEYDKIIETIAWIRKIYWKGTGCITFDEETEKDIEKKIEEIGRIKETEAKP